MSPRHRPSSPQRPPPQPPQLASNLEPTPNQKPMVSLPLQRVVHNSNNNKSSSDHGYGRSHPRRRLDGNRVSLHASLGTHYVYAHVGNPPHRVSLIVDTGSFNMAFPCEGCDECREWHEEAFWDPSGSATASFPDCDSCHGSYMCSARREKCMFRQSYSEGSSWTAHQVADIVRLGGMELYAEEEGGDSKPSRFTFGCILRQSGMFDTQVADGIMGLGPHKDSMVWELEQLKKEGEGQFSLCFAKNGGSMVLGGYDSALIEPGEAIQYTPSYFQSGWFVVKVQDVVLGDTSIADSVVLGTCNGGAGTIVDSGTTDTYLPKAMAAEFDRAWKAVTGKPFDSCEGEEFCMRFTSDEFAKLPMFTILLDGGVSLSLAPPEYMDYGGRRDKHMLYAPRIYLTEATGTILGSNLMMDRNVVFDLTNERLGFVKARCDPESARNAVVSDDDDASAGEEGGGPPGKAVEDDLSQDIDDDLENDGNGSGDGARENSSEGEEESSSVGRGGAGEGPHEDNGDDGVRNRDAGWSTLGVSEGSGQNSVGDDDDDDDVSEVGLREGGSRNKNSVDDDDDGGVDDDSWREGWADGEGYIQEDDDGAVDDDSLRKGGEEDEDEKRHEDIDDEVDGAADGNAGGGGDIDHEVGDADDDGGDGGGGVVGDGEEETKHAANIKKGAAPAEVHESEEGERRSPGLDEGDTEEEEERDDPGGEKRGEQATGAGGGGGGHDGQRNPPTIVQSDVILSKKFGQEESQRLVQEEKHEPELQDEEENGEERTAVGGGDVGVSREALLDGDAVEAESSLCSAPAAGLWGACSEVCEQERFERDGCVGEKQVRACRVGDICRAVSEGVYVDLQLSLDLGPDNLGARRGQDTTARTLRLDSPPIVRYFASDTARWTQFLADALANAVSDRFRKCGVLRGDVNVTVTVPPETGREEGEQTDQSLTTDQEGGGDVGAVVIGSNGAVEIKGGGRGGRGANPTSALVSLHIVNPVVSKTGDKYAPPVVDGCVGGLASPEITSELSLALFDELTRRPDGVGAGAVKGERRDMVHEAFARRVKIVGAGPVALRNARKGYNKIDNHGGLLDGGASRDGGGEDIAAELGRGGGGGLSRQQKKSGVTGSRDSFSGGDSALGGGGSSPMVVFAVQAAAIVALFCTWVLARRWRSRSRVGAAAASGASSRGLWAASGADAAGGARGGSGLAYEGAEEEGDAGERIVMKRL